MDQSGNVSLVIEEDSSQTLTPSFMDEDGKIFTFSAVGSAKNIDSILNSQVSGRRYKTRTIQSGARRRLSRRVS